MFGLFKKKEEEKDRGPWSSYSLWKLKSYEVNRWGNSVEFLL